jgi:nitrogenase molybdenum-iron protein alpha chain
MAHISHGPIGCGQYSRAGRRNYYTGVSGVDSFGTLNFTSDFQERDIVFGGDKKLTKLIEEMELLFPLTKGITIQSECPVGLIGDDISAVANASSKALDKPVIPVRCEGFRGVSQSLGHHIANDVVRDWVLDNREGQPFEPPLMMWPSSAITTSAAMPGPRAFCLKRWGCAWWRSGPATARWWRWRTPRSSS